jgi:hypothetical protein
MSPHPCSQLMSSQKIGGNSAGFAQIRVWIVANVPNPALPV